MNRKEGKTEMIKSITHSFSAQRKLGTFFYHALMIVVSFLMLYPVLWLVASSFKPNGDIFSTATSLFPETLHWSIISTAGKASEVIRSQLFSQIHFW